MSQDVGFEFGDYTETELRKCGDAFIKSCQNTWKVHSPTNWTEYVLDWFAETAATGARVDARKARAPGTRTT